MRNWFPTWGLHDDRHGAGDWLFSSHLAPNFPDNLNQPNSYSESSQDPPHVILTYTALLSLAILRDDFTQLDRLGIVRFLQACQREDGR